VLAGIGAALFALARASGGYYVDGWGAAGLVAAAACALVVVIGLVPARTVLAATAVLVLLGGWSLLSTSWGGIPFQGWRFFDQALLAASALVVGSALAATGRRALVVQAVLAALVLESLEPIVRAIARDVPEDWFYGRRFQGVFGYHSAQASACAVGSAIAVSLLDARRAVPRALYGAAATLMLSVLLLTQSRAGAGAAAAALLVAVLVRRDAAAFVRVVPVAVASGLLVLPLKAVDRALVDASGVDSALRSYAAWTLLAMAIVAAACADPLGSAWLRL
jgi:O-antigen ligase